MPNHYAFFDVHGALSELKELFALVSPSLDDTIVIGGDLIDRGPDSPGVVRFFHQLSLRQRVIYAVGNHENSHNRYRRNLLKDPRVAADMAKRKPELASITAQLSDAEKAFMDSGVLYYQIPGTSVTVLHGGVVPGMQSLPKDPAVWSKYESLIMYTRHVGIDGQMRRLGDVRAGDRFWADVYDGRFGHILFGHEPFTNDSTPRKFPNATGLDLGCVFGGSLACIKVDENGLLTPYVVKAKQVYARGRDRHE